MESDKNKIWFIRNPNISFGIIILIAIFVIDLISALIFIPENFNDFRTPHPYYHHDLLPNRSDKNVWGDKTFDVYTNSLGFKDKSSREVLMESEKKRYLFIGDSYTEGVGMTWNESFVGIIDGKFPNIEILNAGVVSYCPKFYYLKTKYLVEKVGLKFDELFVFIDNSDPLNEITYEDFEPQDINNVDRFIIGLRKYFYNNSYLYYSISNLITSNKRNPVTLRWNPASGNSMVDELEQENSEFLAATLSWSYTLDYYNKWGKRGLELAKNNMDSLLGLCKKNGIKITVVVYPWPSIIDQRDLHNIQVGFWEKYCQVNSVRFINLYPDFINEKDPTAIIKKYFIPGDVHWNTEGNNLVADKLFDYISGYPQ